MAVKTNLMKLAYLSRLDPGLLQTTGFHFFMPKAINKGTI